MPRRFQGYHIKHDQALVPQVYYVIVNKGTFETPDWQKEPRVAFAALKMPEICVECNSTKKNKPKAQVHVKLPGSSRCLRHTELFRKHHTRVGKVWISSL